MTYSDIPLAHTLVTLSKSYGIHQVVISPGSRNAPLILGFAEDPYFECFSIVDERSAGFFAMGLSQQSGKPTLLVCTSGSALLNYYPAVAEAFYSRIPLVVISADRPSYKIDIGDGQTIRQAGVFEKHIGYQAALRQDISHATGAIRWEEDIPLKKPGELQLLQQEIQTSNEYHICQGFQTAIQQKFPVHLNAPFEEPLYGTLDTPEFLPVAAPAVHVPVYNGTMEPLIESWGDARKIMVLIGSLPPGTLRKDVLQRLADDPSVLVFTETTSNVHHPGFFPSIDTLLAPLELCEGSAGLFEALQPDILISLGGMVVSKKIKQFLRTYKPGSHWHIDPLQAPDTYYCLDTHIPLDPDDFLQAFLTRVPKGSFAYKKPWMEYRSAYEDKRLEYLKNTPFTDMRAFQKILREIPGGMQVQLANSSTVRYAQLFDMRPSNAVFCNRGTSGIEGSTSTAVGAAVNSDQPVLLITGDLSFRYDANGLWNQYMRNDFRIIVLNNQGGGIFRILPGSREDDTFETYFETVQKGTFSGLCEQYGISYQVAATADELSEALESFFSDADRPGLLEIITPRKLNDKVLLGYFDFLSSAVPKNLT